MTAGMLVMLLIVITPLWDALRLLDDPTFVFFLGRGLPGWTILCCLLATALYAGVAYAFLALAREEHCTEQSLLMAFATVIGLLGLGFLYLSTPIINQANIVHSDVFFDCQRGASTQVLYEYASVMQELRATPACAAKASVEECEGYQESNPYAGFLKAMEQTYRCAGFCQPPVPAAAASPAATPAAGARHTADVAAAPALASSRSNTSAAELMQDAPSHLQGRLASALFRHFASRSSQSRLQQRLAQAALQTEPEYAPAEQEQGRDSPPVALLQQDHVIRTKARRRGSQKGSYDGPVGKVGAYQPALFSPANYQASCDGMAARDLKYQASDVGNVLFAEGVTLLCAATVVVVLKVGGMFVDSMSLNYVLEVLDGKPSAAKEASI